jgi:DNA-binding CsgD family transcriptional regulator
MTTAGFSRRWLNLSRGQGKSLRFLQGFSNAQIARMLRISQVLVAVIAPSTTL